MKRIILLLIISIYTFTLNAQTYLLRENFSSVILGDNTTTTGSGNGWLGDTNFPTVSYAYKAGGVVKLGNSSNIGSITSKALNLSANNGNFKISFVVKGWTLVEGSITVTVTGLDVQTVTYSAVMSGSFENKELSFTGGTANSTITISTTAKRAFIGDINVYYDNAVTPAITPTSTTILFDATKAEMAGNADWTIDSDLYNISFSDGTAVAGSNSESNPQQYPTPDQASITSSTTEDYWTGGISSWAIDCAKKGYKVETLPYNGQITYGYSSNLQDLSRYKVYVVCEPNIAFTATEKNAIINFVKDGGSLFIVSDHTISDRNSDGIDSPDIWNDLMNNNTIQTNPFGITFNLANISETSSNIADLPTDSILHGEMGNATQLKWSNGTTMTLSKAANSAVSGKVFTTGSSTTGTVNVMFATSLYGKGKVAAIGDSSPCDDGTGDSGDNLYYGYTDLSENHRRLLMNATIWLASSGNLTTDVVTPNANSNDFQIFANPVSNGNLKLSYSVKSTNSVISIKILDLTGKIVYSDKFKQISTGLKNTNIHLKTLNNGIYLCQLGIDNVTTSKKILFRE